MKNIYLLDDGFTVYPITKKEKDLLIQMDCRYIDIYKISNIKLKNSLKEIINGKKIFHCKEIFSENERIYTADEVEFDKVEPHYIDIITYDNKYLYYSFILAENKKDAKNKFINKLKELNIFENNEINIDEALDNKLNKQYIIEKINIIDKSPEKTKELNKLSTEMLEIIQKNLL